MVLTELLGQSEGFTALLGRILLAHQLMCEGRNTESKFRSSRVHHVMRFFFKHIAPHTLRQRVAMVSSR